MSITVQDVRDHYESGASDASVTDAIADAEASVAQVWGDLRDQTVTLSETDPGPAITLVRKPVSLTSVTEVYSLYRSSAEQTQALATNDYKLDGLVLRRLASGTNPPTLSGISRHVGFRGLVTVVYEAEDATALCDAAVRRIVALDLAWNGYSETKAGPFSAKPLDYHQERRRIIRSIFPYAV